jgi:hypothetical protein
MRSNIILKIFVVALATIFTFYGCNEEYKSTTKVNSDGTCERIITVQGDSSYIQKSYFPIPFDKGWNIKWSKRGKDSQHVCILQKKFDDVNEINNDYSDKSKSGIKIAFVKKFRWFFTYYDYKETYYKNNIFNKISLSSFLPKREYEKYLEGDTSVVLKKRLDKYFRENLFIYLHDRIWSVIKNLNDPQLSFKLFDDNVQAIHDTLMSSECSNSKDLIGAIGKVIKSKSLFKLKPYLDDIMKELFAKRTANDIKYKFTSEIIMPGIILNTNAPVLEGNKVIWNFSPDRFRYADITMSVESRILNVWAIILTAIIGLAIIILLLLPKFKKASV